MSGQESNLRAVHYRHQTPPGARSRNEAPNNPERRSFLAPAVIIRVGPVIYARPRSLFLALLQLPHLLGSCFATHARNFSTAGFGEGLEAHLLCLGRLL